MKYLVIMAIALFIQQQGISESKIFTEQELSQEQINKLEFSGEVCLLVPTGQIVPNDEGIPSDNIADELNNADGRFPWLPIRGPTPSPTPEQPRDDLPIESPSPPDNVDSPPKWEFPIFGRLLDRIGKFFWQIMNYWPISITIFVILGGLIFSILSQILTPFYGSDWAKVITEDVVRQIKGFLGGLLSIFSSNNEEPEEIEVELVKKQAIKKPSTKKPTVKKG